METRIFHPEHDTNAVAEAAAILRRGGLLGIPTETVYGLGADALNEDAVRRIFEAKGRPQDNPLIIHVPSADWLERYCQNVPAAAYRLAEKFWPGPLTMILPRLLRPGGLPLEALERVLGEIAVDDAVRRKMGEGEHPRAPGMKYRHYAPKAPVTVVTGPARRSAAYIRDRLPDRAGVICFDEYAPLFAGHIVHRLGAADDKLSQAQHVFDALRTFDDTDVSEIYAQCPDESGLGLAVANRLKKAAGFHVVDVSPLIIGFTGPTGAGKTSALRALERLGGLVLDCDAVYHQLLRTDAPLRAAITAAFGPVFTPDGALDRQKLGAAVFSDPAALDRLNAIIFDRLPRELLRRVNESDATMVGIDAINLVESGLSRLCRRTVAVLAPTETRVRRIMARDGISEDYARLRVQAQKPDEFYRAHCTDVLMNDAASPQVFEEIAYQRLQHIFEEEADHE